MHTPSVDGVANDGAAFMQAISPVPVTLPAHASLFTGRNPAAHGVRSNGVFRLRENETTLAEVMSQAGYTTAAFIGASVLHSRYGLNRGFSHYDDRVDLTDQASRVGAFAQRRGETVVAAALDWLETHHGDPTLVWVHLYDPHVPYSPPLPEKERFESAPYDGEIAYADRVVGRLLEGYRALDAYDNTIVVITSDHGEGLGDHGENTHGVFVYDTTLRVPLVVKGPGIEPGIRVTHPVSLIDLFPTICELVDLPVPKSVEGIGLTALMNPSHPSSPNRLVYFESYYSLVAYGWAPYRGLRSADYKLIEGRHDELYHLKSDPGELKDLVATDDARRASLKAWLQNRYPEREPLNQNRIRVDADARRQLMALGYVAGQAETGDASRDDRPDPRERIHLAQAMQGAIEMFLGGDHTKAIAQAEEVVRQTPESAQFARQLAYMYRTTGDSEKALAQYQRAASINPRDADAQNSVAQMLHKLNRVDDAITAYGKAISIDPKSRIGRHNRWVLMIQNNRSGQVLREAATALSHDPADGEAIWAAVVSKQGTSDPDEMVAAFEQALTRAPDDPTLLVALAKILEERGELGRAETFYQRAFDGRRASWEAGYRLGRIMVAAKRWAEARPIVESTVATHRNPELLLLLSEISYMSGDHDGALRSLREVVSIEPARGDVWGTMGDVLLARGQLREALDAYREATRLGSNTLRIQKRIGELRLRLEQSAYAPKPEPGPSTQPR